MKLGRTIIKDENSNTYFGFMKHIPGICVQALSKEELNTNLNNHLMIYLEKNRPSTESSGSVNFIYTGKEFI